MHEMTNVSVVIANREILPDIENEALIVQNTVGGSIKTGVNYLDMVSIRHLYRQCPVPLFQCSSTKQKEGLHFRPCETIFPDL